MNDPERLLTLLPSRLRCALNTAAIRQAEELRLRVGFCPTLLLNGTEKPLQLRTGPGEVTQDDLSAILLAVSRQSVYAVQNQLRNGFLSVPGGCRIGVCGMTVLQDGQVISIREPSSLAIRIAHDIRIPDHLMRGALSDSCLILGAPGNGKTTLLRNCIRVLSSSGERVCIVDERMEIGGCVDGRPQFDLGPHTDILSGCSKRDGIFRLLRAMNPTWIAVDEITDPEDLEAMHAACRCGVRLIATVHAASREELAGRTLFRSLMEQGLFDNYLILDSHKSFRNERSIP